MDTNEHGHVQHPVVNENSMVTAQALALLPFISRLMADNLVVVDVSGPHATLKVCPELANDPRFQWIGGLTS